MRLGASQLQIGQVELELVSKVIYETLDNPAKHTLMTLLRILLFGQIGSTKLVLPKWQNIDILNRDNRVFHFIQLHFHELLGKTFIL